MLGERTMNEIIFYDYHNSTAAYRVRMALNLKQVVYKTAIVDLVAKEQSAADYKARNPQGLVPMLSIDGHDLSQSLAIIDYLDAKYAEPAMVSSDPAERSKTLAQALVIASDVHPINNLRVWQYLKDPFGHSQDDVLQWMHHWMQLGFETLEAQAPQNGLFGGDMPNLTDICFFAQMHNANRFGLLMDAYPKLRAIEAAMKQIPEIAAAHPDMVAAD